MNTAGVVVDANIAFKCLVSDRGDLRERLGPGRHPQFFSPLYLFVELFKHKDRLTHASGLPEPELLEGIHTLLHSMEFISEANIPVGTWMEAHRLCRGIDEKDTPYLALTLHLGGRLWTEDHELKAGLRARGFDGFYEP